MPSTTTSETWTQDDGSFQTQISYEDGREQVRSSNPGGLARIQSGVDVERAEKEFAELNRQFSHISKHARRKSKQGSQYSNQEDLEKSGSPSDSVDEPWNLESTLHGSKAAEAEAGIKSKHIGTVNTFFW